MQQALDRVSARQAVRRRQSGIHLPRSLRSAPGAARREAAGPGRGLPQHRLRPGEAVCFAPAAAWFAASTLRSTGASCGARNSGPIATPTASICAAWRTSGACSTKSRPPRTTVIPNAADVDYYQPRPTDPQPDGRTVVFFGLLSYMPNIDGVIYFVQEIWPRIAEAHPQARCKIIGGWPPPSLLALAGPRIEFTGFVPDLRPHLAEAAAVVVPLRLGGGTRLKIVEAMAMGKAIVSTTLGAEGIEAVPGRDSDRGRAGGLRDAVNRLLAEPGSAARIGQSARQLSVARYAWSAAAQALEGFYRQVLDRRS